MEKEIQQVIEVFDKLEISYQLIEHPPLYSAKIIKDLKIDFKGATCCKNLLLKDEKTKELYLFSLAVEKRADLKKLAKKLRSNRLTFATEEELITNLGVTSGNVSLLNIILCQKTKVTFVIDKNLLEADEVCFHPNKNTASIIYPSWQMEHILKEYGAEYIFIDMS